MNNRKRSRRGIKIRGWFRLLGLVAAAASVVVFVCLLTAQRNRIAEERSAAAVRTPSPAYAASGAPDGLPDVDITSWELALVNDGHHIEKDYAPPDLTEIELGQEVDSRIAVQLEALIAAARSCGYDVYFCSGYRSYQTQHEIYWNHVWDYVNEGMSQADAEAKTKLSVNEPGASEHQLGLAVDLLEYQGQDMESYIGGSGLMDWFAKNCCRFGFVVRYPDGKTDLTGVEYEPWHLRYVGEAAATYMMDNNLCLEEFLAFYQ
jgi:D-alanyl-D-alanine carboxypeptidase